LRYPEPDGKLYSGFVAKSADKILNPQIIIKNEITPPSLLWIVLLTILPGCGPGNSGTNGNSLSAAPVEKGKIISKITCRKYYTISYALYLPKNYTTGLKFPVIIAFDPHGSGILPLENTKTSQINTDIFLWDRMIRKWPGYEFFRPHHRCLVQ